MGNISKKWSRKHDRCVECGSNSRKHYGRGVCAPCYQRHWFAANEERLKEYKHRWYVESGGADYVRELKEKRVYSGNRDAAMERDGYKCVRCGSGKKLNVHHRDRMGVQTPEFANHSLDNLETLCASCHMKEHMNELQNARRFESRSGTWDPKGVLAGCRRCGRSDRPHYGIGFCNSCYVMNRRNKTRKEVNANH